jgi:hypothetical protein
VEEIVVPVPNYNVLPGCYLFVGLQHIAESSFCKSTDLADLPELSDSACRILSDEASVVYFLLIVGNGIDQKMKSLQALSLKSGAFAQSVNRLTNRITYLNLGIII